MNPIDLILWVIMDIKLIALDMDGTVLDSESEISALTKTAITALIAQNIHIVLCTGRTLSELKMVLRVLPDLRFLICSNGANIYDLCTGKSLYDNLLDNKKIHEIHRLLSGFDMMFEIYADHKIYLDEYCWYHPDEYGAGFLKKQMAESRTPIADMRNFVKVFNKPAEKLNIFFKNRQERINAWDMCSTLDVALTSSIHENIEINASSSNKGNALGYLLQCLQVPSYQTMAIGDSINDISMMQAAGFKVAMGNAISDVKRIADVVTESNDRDGVAVALYRYVLHTDGIRLKD